MMTHEQAVEYATPPYSTTSRRSQLISDLAGRFSEDGIQHRKRAQHRRFLCWTVAIWSGSALRRSIDVLAAALLILVVSPLMVASILTSRFSGLKIKPRTRLGRWATHFSQYELDGYDTGFWSFFAFARAFPSFFNVLRGDMSFVGPRAAELEETFPDQRHAWKRYNLRPGLLSPWWLRKRANIAYTSEVRLDLEYIETHSFWGDMGIAIRTIPIAFLGDGSTTGARIVRFLGIEIDNLTMSEASAQIVAISKGDDPVQVCFVNADCVNIAFRDEQYMSILRESRLVLADGIGVRLAGMMLNQKIRENINGTDMLPFLCGAAQESGSSLYLLGGKPGVPEATARWIMERYPRLTIAGAQHGFFSAEEESDVIRSIASSGTNILLVALGAPIQEKWIHSNKHRLGVQVSIGVGGLFDFYSGRIPRAPIWLRELGCEWFYRFWREPRRMARRYLIGNSVFLFRLARERVSESVSRRRRRVGV